MVPILMIPIFEKVQTIETPVASRKNVLEMRNLEMRNLDTIVYLL